MTFALANLSRPAPTDLPKIYLGEEIGYREAYKQHYLVSQYLRSGANLEREAYYALLFAIECFLKDAFCIIRYAIIGDIRSFGPPPFQNKIHKSLNALTFNHDLSKLSSMLASLSPEVAGDADYMLFHANLPKDGWVNERYDNPAIHKKIDYTLKYDNLSAVFSSFVDAKLGGLK